jgi:hypothetical protein
LALIVLGAVSIAPLSGIGQNSNNNSVQETTIVGFISDSMCGLKHMSGMGDDKNCTLACIKQGSKFVLADRDHKRTYKLDQAGQEKAREFAGQKVKVTGSVSGKTIKVTNIEPA